MDETVNFNPVNTQSNNLIKMQSNVKDDRGGRKMEAHVRGPHVQPLGNKTKFGRKGLTGC